MLPSYLRKFDWVLFGAAALLAVFGLAAIYSTSLGAAGTEGTERVVGDFSNFWKQATFAGVGLALAMLLPALDHRLLSGLAKVLYVASILLLAAVLFFGETVRGTKGWFGIAGFGVQPVEIVKLFLIVYLAKFFSDYARRAGGLKQIVGSGVAIAGVLILVLLQPDFGSAFLLLAVWGSLLLVAGVKRTHLVAIVVLGALAAIVAWSLVLKPYQKDRIFAFWDPSADPLGRGYNVTQSIIAIGSGGLTGKGLGFGSQSQLRFLPERQTDFIFAVIAEELGFVGVLFVIGLFGVVFLRAYRLASDARDDFTQFLVLGIAASLAIEAAVNIGGNLRLMPVTGVTLPFLSYGGSSLLTKFLMIGILQSVAVRR